MNHCIVEKPAGMPDWVEIGIKFWGRYGSTQDWRGPFILTGFDIDRPTLGSIYRDQTGNWYTEAKPYTPWTPKEGEWCAFWCGWDKYITLRPFSGTLGDKYMSPITAKDGRIAWDYCARITNDDGSFIDIRCTVDELKAKTDWLGPEEA